MSGALVFGMCGVIVVGVEVCKRGSAALTPVHQPRRERHPDPASTRPARDSNSAEMDRSAVQFGGEFNAANQVDPGLVRQGQRFLVTLKRVVIGNAERIHPGRNRFVNQLRGRIGAVGLIRV